MKRGPGRPKKVKVEVDTPKKRRGRPAGSKLINGKLVLADALPKVKPIPKVKKVQKVKKVKKVKVDTPTPKKRGRPFGSKGKKKSTQTNQVDKAKTSPVFLQAGKIVYTKDGIALAGFPDVSVYKQPKRQERLVDQWLLDQATGHGLKIVPPLYSDRDALNEYLFGKDETYVTAKKKRGRVKAPEVEVKAKKAPKLPEAPEVPKRRRGRPRKAPEPVTDEGDVIVSEVTSSVFLGYCPDGCDSIISSSDKVSERKVECISCGQILWIKDLAPESSKEKPRSEKEWNEGSVSLDFCTEVRPIKSSKSIFDEKEESPTVDKDEDTED